MNISEAKTFLAVVATRNISKAAKALYLAQSTVSFQIKALEKELGVNLLERNKGQRQIVLTPSGQEFVYIAERFVQVWNEAHALKYNSLQTLTISSVDSLNIYMFSPLYRQIIQEEEGIRLKVFTHQTPEIFEHVEHRIADIGFVLSQRYYQNIVMKPVFRERLVFVQRREKGGEGEVLPPIHAKELDFKKEVFFSWSPEFNNWHGSWCNPDIQPAIQVDTIAMLRNILREGFWAIVPPSLIPVLGENSALISRTITEGPPDRICYKLVHRFPKPSQRDSIEAFEERLSRFMAENGIEYQQA